MRRELTIFKSIFDNKTDKKMSFASWEDFVKLLKQLSGQPGYKPKKFEKKKGSSLITPAVFKKGTTRANHNVIRWSGWCALDIDEVVSVEETLKLFEGYEYVCYSTASSTVENPKFRIALKLDRDVPADKIRHFWYALNKEFNSMGDEQTKDLSRMYYVPAKYPNAQHFFIHNRGEDLNVKRLMDSHIYSARQSNNLVENLPEEMQRKYEDFRKSNLTNHNFKWNGIDDCPFVNQSLVKEYMNIIGTGWYHTMFKMMCSIAMLAMRKGYPITNTEIASLARELDSRSGNYYNENNRPFEREADRAIKWATFNI